MIRLLKNHTLILAYSLVFAGVAFGVYKTSGTDYFAELGIYYFFLVIFYLLFNTKPIHRFFERMVAVLHKKKWNFTINYLLLFVIGFIIVHFIYLGGSPAIKATGLYYAEDVAILRNSINKDVPVLITYIASICIRGLLPFLLLYLLVKKRQGLYWLVLALAVFYCFSLMQKSFIVGLLIPSVIYCGFNRRYLMALKDIAIIAMVVVGLTLISNPPGARVLPVTETGPAQMQTGVENSKLQRIGIGLYNRVLIVPGEMVSAWFRLVPAEKPFLNGDGYRLVAKLRGRPFVNYSVELYKLMYPEFVEQGVIGSVNVASFMYDYANFGKVGLILSGLMLAFMLFLLEFLFTGDPVIKTSLNLFHVLLLSSGAITTLLFSGGWGFLILLYYFFLHKPE